MEASLPPCSFHPLLSALPLEGTHDKRNQTENKCDRGAWLKAQQHSEEGEKGSLELQVWGARNDEAKAVAGSIWF